VAAGAALADCDHCSCRPWLWANTTGISAGHTERGAGPYGSDRAASTTEWPDLGPDDRLPSRRRSRSGPPVAAKSLRRTTRQQWPVLYLLHGCCDTYVSWTGSTDIERLSAQLDALVVMPDGGQVGFYSDWLDGPGWETFHTSELPQLLASEYRANGRAAIAGVSMGGLGALGYAARHPGEYAVAASFSGIVHTRLTPNVARGYLALVQSYDSNPLGLWGDPDKQSDVWKRHNPYDFAPQLRGTRLFISSGNGQPGPLDLEGAVTDQIETGIGNENTAFGRRLRQLGIDAKLDLYGDGTHNWVYWQRSLHRAWPLITDALQS
jgi:diacylglycerol O-acyltransferase/trehalose O-mycolyltransferase